MIKPIKKLLLSFIFIKMSIEMEYKINPDFFYLIMNLDFEQ